MNHILRILSLVLTLATANNLCAQVTPAWTRQLSPAHWQELSRGVVLPHAKGVSPFMNLARRVAAEQQVKTTDQNWIRHKVFYSGVFSKQEKELLLSSDYPQATLGKIVYLHNKHAAFYNQLTARYASQYFSPKAFQRHQQILQELTGALQQYYAPNQAQMFASQVFSTQEIQRLQTLPAQPTAYVLSPKELAEFAGLPSQLAQQYWTERHIVTLRWETEMLLLKQTQEMTPAEFEQYYRASRRLSYFQLLARVLARADGKRPSAIVRYKLPLTPESEILTDAQRGGKLLLRDGEDSVLFKEFKQNYGPYAAAEALGAPYEIALQYGDYAPELLGPEEGQRLRQLDPKTCLEELLPKITHLESQLEQLRNAPRQGDSFYTFYYALHARLEIYQTLAARARFMLHF